MRGWVLMLGCVLATTPMAAQERPLPDAPEQAPITVTTRLRHVSTVVLPETAEIVDMVVGDRAQWDVSAAAHVAFIRPLVAGSRSNLVLLTATGDIVPLTLVERADAPVDAVVRVGMPQATRADATPLLASAAAVDAAAARVEAAWAAVATAEATAVERLAAARTAAQAQLDANRERYPRQVHVDYRWPAEATDAPWHVEGMWHDGRRTYLRTRAVSPVLYERTDGDLTSVDVSSVLDGVLHVVPRVLEAGALEVDGERLLWSVSPRQEGP